MDKRLIFAININNKGSGIVDTSATRVICYCSEAQSFIILDAFEKASRTTELEQLNKEQSEEIEILKQHKADAFRMWNAVDEYVRNLPSVKLGDSISDKTLEFLKAQETTINQLQERADKEMIDFAEWIHFKKAKFNEVKKFWYFFNPGDLDIPDYYTSPELLKLFRERK